MSMSIAQMFVQVRPTYEATGALRLPAGPLDPPPRPLRPDEPPRTHTCFVRPTCVYTTQGSVVCPDSTAFRGHGK
jgi:hypothetical protein